MTTLTTIPRYDLFEGLGRRRRLRQLGLDPDVQIERSERDDNQLEVSSDETRSTKAA